MKATSPQLYGKWQSSIPKTFVEFRDSYSSFYKNLTEETQEEATGTQDEITLNYEGYCFPRSPASYFPEEYKTLPQ